jgi:predicted DNA binding CopG/RHH family protein
MEREQTTIRLPTELMEQLRREAQERGYPVKDLIMFILSDYVENQDSPADNSLALHHDSQHT